jgi:hypothetical protein
MEKLNEQFKVVSESYEQHQKIICDQVLGVLRKYHESSLCGGIYAGGFCCCQKLM